MKRFLLIMFCIPMLIVLGSCAPPKPSLKDSFTLPVSITGELECTAELIGTPDSLTLTILSGEPLSGLSYTYTDGELCISYNGLSRISQADSLPDTALPDILCHVVRDIKNAAYLRSDEGGDVFQLNGTTVTIKDGLPVRIDCAKPRYSVLVKN